MLGSGEIELILDDLLDKRHDDLVKSKAGKFYEPDADRRAAFLEYFANPSPEMREVHAAWEAAVLLYGDEDSDAWMAALEDGAHPLCRVGSLARRA
jgi:hypothetical protein